MDSCEYCKQRKVVLMEEWSLHLEDITHWMPLPKPPSKG